MNTTLVDKDDLLENLLFTTVYLQHWDLRWTFQNYGQLYWHFMARPWNCHATGGPQRLIQGWVGRVWNRWLDTHLHFILCIQHWCAIANHPPNSHPTYRLVNVISGSVPGFPYICGRFVQNGRKHRNTEGMYRSMLTSWDLVSTLYVIL